LKVPEAGLLHDLFVSKLMKPLSGARARQLAHCRSPADQDFHPKMSANSMTQRLCFKSKLRFGGD